MDFRTDLGRVKCPTLVMGGGLDPVMPMRSSETIAASLPPSSRAAQIVYRRAKSGSCSTPGLRHVACQPAAPAVCKCCWRLRIRICRVRASGDRLKAPLPQGKRTHSGLPEAIPRDAKAPSRTANAL